jgi:hypothetical protein
MRNNIFELLSNEFDIDYEIDIICKLFMSKSIYYSNTSGGITYITISRVVNINSFADWKARDRCVSCEDMINRLHINDFVNKPHKTIENTFTIIEFILNICKRCDIALERSKRYYASPNYEIIKRNCENFIAHLGYESKTLENDQKVIIVEINPAATSAAEISKPEIANKIMQYNHYLLRGNIQAKKEIILLLANEIEPKQESLRKHYPSISDDLSCLLNNMNLRHNNIEASDKNYKEYVFKMLPTEIENWYDEIYQLELLSKLLIDNVERQKKIKELKKFLMVLLVFH